MQPHKNNLRRGELSGELGWLGAAGAEEGARLEGDDRPRVQPQRPRVRREVAQQARRVEETYLQKTDPNSNFSTFSSCCRASWLNAQSL